MWLAWQLWGWGDSYVAGVNWGGYGAEGQQGQFWGWGAILWLGR